MNGTSTHHVFSGQVKNVSSEEGVQKDNTQSKLSGQASGVNDSVLNVEEVSDVGQGAKPGSEVDVGSKQKLRHTRAASCPPRTGRPVGSGPWSLEWLDDQHHSEAGVVSSSRKVGKKGARHSGYRPSGDGVAPSRKNVGGLLRHSVLSLKKVVRLPDKDRAAVMKILKRKGRKYQGSTKLKRAVNMISTESSEDISSSSSSNNDWHNWVIVHGSEKVLREDARSIGDTIGVQLGECNNMFGVLARKGVGKKKRLASVEGGVKELEVNVLC